MAGWISSKLKVAESLLQQIDQQAAESLGKSEKPQSPSSSSSSLTFRGDGVSSEILKKTADSSPSPSLKYQLPTRKKSTPPAPPRSPLPPSPAVTSPATAGRSSPDPAVIDWTELLSSPAPASPSPMKKTISVNSKKSLIPISQKRETVTVSDGYRENTESSSLAEKQQQQQREEEEEEENQRGNSKGNDGDREVSPRDRDDETSGSSSGSEDDDSETDDDYDSEDERQKAEERRKRREEMIAAKAAAVAAKAIKDKEDSLAKLEGEKQSLEKMLEEREKQQAQEASELQMSMIEAMEAAELEKEKHNSTRMEAFARLSQLETTNAELARSLAMVQWNLEVEVSRISELRQKIELRELAQQERRRRKLKIHQMRSSSIEEPLRKEELVQEILDAEYTFVCGKIAQLKDKAKMIEDNIESIKRERVYPTEVEVELRKRLAQLTDHLIQKQTQVEALSSERATLSLRIEMISRLLEENGSSLQATDPSKIDARRGSSFDIESGTWHRLSKSEALHEQMRSGRQHLGSILQQLDSIFSAGAVFVRRNRAAQLWASIYLLCLHIWVIYILFSSNSRVSDDNGSHGAVFSLENINKTSAS